MNWDLTWAIAVGGSLAYYAGKWLNVATSFAIDVWGDRGKTRRELEEVRAQRMAYAEALMDLDRDHPLRQSVDVALAKDQDGGYIDLGRAITTAMFGAVSGRLLKPETALELGRDVAGRVREIEEERTVRSVEQMFGGDA